MSALPMNGQSAPQQAIMFDPRLEREAQRKRLMAEIMLKQGNAPVRNEQAGGMTVLRSPWENIAQGAQKYMGEYELGRSDDIAVQNDVQRGKLLSEALGQLESDPRAAYATLAQDPSMGGDALKLYADALNTDKIAAAKADDRMWEMEKLERQLQNQREVANIRANSAQGGGYTIDPETGATIPTYSNKPLPAAALKMQQEAIDALSASKNISDNARLIGDQLNSGALEVGPATNLGSELRNWAGMSSPNSQAYGNLKTTLEKIRNDTLRLNKGVQTEGDAQRALNEVLQSTNDPVVLQNALNKLDEINTRAAELQRLNVNNIRENYNAAPYDFEGVQQLPTATGQSQQGGSNIRSYLTSKGLAPAQIDAFLRSKGMQ